jgi:XTP/dITP diphosphohydrolase
MALATRNPGKAREYGRLLGGADLEPLDVEVEETGETFAENALAKARAAAAAAPGRIGMGDDSGLAVEALGGAPGVRSARFAPGSDDDRSRALLDRLGDAMVRDAAFVCALAAVAPDGREMVVEGRLEGAIARAPAGSGGFGYDPVFVPRGETRTVAELEPAEKDAISHRGRAARAMLDRLRREGLAS